MRFFLWIAVFFFGMIFSIHAAAEGLYESHGKRDPFVSLMGGNVRSVSGLEGVVSADEIKVEGIVYQKDSSIAIINGSVLREGESLGGVKVLQIKPDGVSIVIGGVEAFKPLYQDDKNDNQIS